MEYIAIILAVYATLKINKNEKRINHIERDLTENTTRPVKKDEHIETLRKAGIVVPKAIHATKLATAKEWKIIDVQPNIKMIRYMRTQDGDVQKVNIYYGGKGNKLSQYTVATIINHPTRGKTQLFRKGVDLKQLERILDNPRIHTDKGYYNK